ncbi:N-acetyltransferase [Flavobacterium cupreum]|uniref:N-acetyltransferase n=2 Tax=Flavobacterium TaxID=237 RepID=A0A940XAZ9_9FLAO|nr:MULTISPECIES: N-acetyltransferase [Flavobacterium]MBP4140011.1 N-acetyltransferase [Flavobacterium geliluteum]RUT67800.1 N-acetyltransferase [Flavobacterium cupreum]
MEITHVKSSQKKDVVIELVSEEDYLFITEDDYHFDWELEKKNVVYKLKFPDDDEILGLMSLKDIPSESRVEIILLASSVINTGKNKIYDGIAGNLIAFACRESVRLYADNAFVSLHPKTELKSYYMAQYGFQNAGIQIYLESTPMFNLMNKYQI